jgi:hypothetical protein
VTEEAIRSLETILEQVRSEREAQLRHFDALDAKAGIILGFAGALVALAPVGSLLVDGGRYVAAVSGLLALWTFSPRRFDVIELRALRDLYLASEPAFTKVRLLDTQIAMSENLTGSLHRKAWRLKLAMSFLAMAALTSAIGLGLD